MSLQFTSEQFRQLKSERLPVFIEDPASQAKYVIISQDEYRRIISEDLQREIKLGVDEVERGEVAEWDVEAVIAEAKRRFDTEELS